MTTGVVGIEQLADGFRITMAGGRIITLTSADIPSNVKSGSLSGVQTWVTNWLQSQQPWFASCRIISVTPLVANVVLGDKAIPAARPV